MANYYGGGGNSLDFNQLLNGVTSLMQGINGSPDLMFRNRQMQISEGNAAQSAAQFGARQSLGNIVTQGIQRDPKGRVVISPEAAGAAALSGDLPALTGLARGMSEPASQDIDTQARLQLGLLNAPSQNRDLYYYGLNSGQGQGFQDYEAARAYSRSQAAQDATFDDQRKLSYETEKAKALGGIFDVNHAPYAAAMRIYNDPSTPQPEKDKQIELLRSFLSASSGSVDPEAKAKAEVHQQQLMLEQGYTPPANGQPSIQQGLQDIKSRGSIAETIAKGVSDMTYPNASTPTGRTAILMDAAGMPPDQQLAYPAGQEIRVSQFKAITPDINTAEGKKAILMAQLGMPPDKQLSYDSDRRIEEARLKAELDSLYPNISTETGYRAIMAQRSGIPAAEQYATEIKPLVIPEGATTVIPRGSYLERNFRPSADKVAAAKEAEVTLTSMTQDELRALPREQLLRLKQAIDAGKSAYPAPMQPENIGGRFPTKAEAPKSGQIVYDGSLNSATAIKLAPVKPQVDSEFDKLLDAYDGVARAIEAVNKNPKAFGSHFGIASSMPMFGNMAKNALLDEGETAARAAVFDATAKKKHEIYGAALTGGEQIDANNFLPSSSDSPEVVREKLDGLQSQLHTLIERRMDTFHPFAGSHFLKSYESGRKLIDPASMERAKRKNTASSKNGANIKPRED